MGDPAEDSDDGEMDLPDEMDYSFDESMKDRRNDGHADEQLSVSHRMAMADSHVTASSRNPIEVSAPVSNSSRFKAM